MKREHNVNEINTKIVELLSTLRAKRPDLFEEMKTQLGWSRANVWKKLNGESAITLSDCEILMKYTRFKKPFIDLKLLSFDNLEIGNADTFNSNKLNEFTDLENRLNSYFMTFYNGLSLDQLIKQIETIILDRVNSEPIILGGKQMSSQIEVRRDSNSYISFVDAKNKFHLMNIIMTRKEPLIKLIIPGNIHKQAAFLKGIDHFPGRTKTKHLGSGFESNNGMPRIPLPKDFKDLNKLLNKLLDAFIKAHQEDFHNLS